MTATDDGQHWSRVSAGTCRQVLEGESVGGAWSVVSDASSEQDEPSGAYLLRTILETNSGWSSATMNGIRKPVASEHEILQGEDAPDLPISAASPSLVCQFPHSLT